MHYNYIVLVHVGKIIMYNVNDCLYAHIHVHCICKHCLRINSVACQQHVCCRTKVILEIAKQGILTKQKLQLLNVTAPQQKLSRKQAVRSKEKRHNDIWIK